MKYFIDTEFIEHAGGVDLVSIGIVCEDGREFYAESSEFDPRVADPWVQANVLSKLVYWGKWNKVEPLPILFGVDNSSIYGTQNHIKNGLLNFFGYKAPANIEIYGYYSDYDWVVFCRLFGRMIDLPKGMPMWCIDLKQMMWERGLTKEWKLEACLDPEGEHNAMMDARWNQMLYKAMETHFTDINR